jgi:hypothetical protein
VKSRTSLGAPGGAVAIGRNADSSRTRGGDVNFGEAAEGSGRSVGVGSS